MNKRIKVNGGFTLLEVLIALAVLAILASAVVSQTSHSTRQLQILEQKTHALWVAEYHLNKLRIADQWPSIGRSSQTIEYAGNNWLINTQISSTSEPWLRKITVMISSDHDASQQNIITLTGYKGKH